jgi:ubiquinone/menaquinone biosynthesis C-methylase UbiE
MKDTSWDRVYRQHGQVQFDILPKVEIAATNFAQKRYRKVLDLACGTGRHAIYLAKQGFDVTASDISENGLIIVRQKAASASLKIEVKHHDMKAVPYPKDYFDAVLCVWSIDIGTLDNIVTTVGEIHRILKTDGTVVADFISVKDETYGRGKEIDRNTFVGAMPGLPDLVEHYSTREELTQVFSRFGDVKIEEADHFYKDEVGRNHLIKAFDVEATK